MQIPFAGAALKALGRGLGRRGQYEGFEDLDDLEDGFDDLTGGELPPIDTVLLLQKMENRLVRHHLEHPDVLREEELRKLRYILNFARLADFEPGAAGPGGRRGRGDVAVGAEVAPWRAQVADALYKALYDERDAPTALSAARDVLETLTQGQDEQRRLLAERHSDEFSLPELDAEVGYKKLVLVLGGGGGAGFVYIGGMHALLEAGQVPDYMIGSSFGSIIGSVVGRALPVPLQEYIDWAKTVSYGAILGPEKRYRRHGLTGLFSLQFDEFARALFSREDGDQMHMADLAIPFEAVIAGVRKRSYAALPSKYRRSKLAALQSRSIAHLPLGLGPQVSIRMWQAAAFIDSRVSKPIVIGGDDLSSDMNVVDAASFSSAIPGVLHHETGDPRMYPILDAILEDHDISAIIDGGAASNVPIEMAWKRIRDGKLGTRNACYLAFDCFHPQWDPRHLWLAPITQAVQLQMVRNAPYADHLVRFAPTPSPVNLAPSVDAIDQAYQWGRNSVDRAVPVTSALLEPTWWEGDGPPVPELVAHRKSVAASMSSVMGALRASTNQSRRWPPRRRG